MEYNDVKLLKLYWKVNEQYFDSKILISKIAWASKSELYSKKISPYRIWAIYHPGEKYILINNCLNKPGLDIPQFVLEYLIYHELLHNFWIYHCVSFRLKEKRFLKYDQAVEWLRLHEDELFNG